MPTEPEDHIVIPKHKVRFDPENTVIKNDHNLKHDEDNYISVLTSYEKTLVAKNNLKTFKFCKHEEDVTFIKTIRN